MTVTAAARGDAADELVRAVGLFASFAVVAGLLGDGRDRVAAGRAFEPADAVDALPVAVVFVAVRWDIGALQKNE